MACIFDHPNQALQPGPGPDEGGGLLPTPVFNLHAALNQQIGFCPVPVAASGPATGRGGGDGTSCWGGPIGKFGSKVEFLIYVHLSRNYLIFRETLVYLNF